MVTGARAFGVAFVAIWSLVAGPLRAEFAVCNQTFDVINVAVGQSEEDTFVTRGWWTVGPNQCANVIRDPLPARYVYIFAKDVFGKEILNGTDEMCISTRKFTIRGETDCLLRGYLPARFIEVDTQRTERWTLFLAPTPS
ncbi:DUF1036 domain-containing protein [Aestuariibius sp. 2305UL40-4]